MLKGRLITIEGLEGSGKSTLMNLLQSKMKSKNVIFTNEFSHEFGKQIYTMIKSKRYDPITELFLFEAARREHFVNVIFPALQKGKIVIMDRFTDSTLAYQGFFQDIGLNYVINCNNLATAYSNLQLLNVESVKPDLTIFLDVEFKTAQKRLRARANSNQIDRLDMEEFETIRNGYQKSFSQHSTSQKVETIDVTHLKPEQVLNKASQIIGRFLKDLKAERDNYGPEVEEELALMTTLQGTRLKENTDEF